MPRRQEHHDDPEPEHHPRPAFSPDRGYGKLLGQGAAVLSGQKLHGYRFPLAVIGQAIWLYHRFTLSYRDVEELLLERDITVTRETIRTQCIKFSVHFAQGLRYREPCRGSRWHLDEMCVDVGGVKHWLWRAGDEHGAVLDVLLQQHRDTEAAKSFFQRLLEDPTRRNSSTLTSSGAMARPGASFPCSTPWSTSRSYHLPAATT